MPHHAWPATEPTEVTLTAGEAEATVDLRGGGLRRLAAGDWDVLDGYVSGEIPAGRRGGVLFPWPNRIRDGRWSWRGKDLQLPVVSPGTTAAMHGLVSAQPWHVLDRADGRVSVGTVLEKHSGYPFRLAAAIDYVLSADGLDSTLRVRNVGDEPAPFGAGMHPYLFLGGTAEGDVGRAGLDLPARTRLVVDDAGLPTGERRAFDGAVGTIGERVLDDPLTDLDRDDDGWARVRLRGPAGTVELAVDGAWPWLQVYTGDTLPPGQRRRSVAVEPMTCPPNAFADDVDLIVLEPAAEWSGTWTLRWSAV